MDHNIENIKREELLIGRISWLINLRWIAITGVISTTYIANHVFRISLPTLKLYIVAVVLASYNLVLFFVVSRSKYKLLKGPSNVSILANVQIAFDLTCLAVLIHFSGGIENPFIFYSIFHMIIASILLTRRAAFLQATYAIVLFFVIVIFEYSHYLPHYCLEILPYCLHDNKIYIFADFFVFITMLYIAVYMTTSITKRLKEREQNLRDANELLNEKDQIKSKYVLRVTHDIKEDLSTIQSCIEPVTSGLLGSLNEGQENLLNRANKRSAKLIFYVRSLLDITRLKLTKELKMQDFDFSALIHEIVEHTISMAKNKQITFEVDIDTNISTIKGVRIYIYETICNLLTNSVKYTNKGGKVNLKVQGKGDSLLITIKDTGMGIPKDELPHIFEEFYRAQNARQQERQGTGLGLSMAKQVIEMHNGRIWIESKEGKGTKVFIELPYVT